MKHKPLRWRPKRVLRLPDLDHAKAAVLNTLGSPDSQRSYRFAIDDFIAWYCSEPRLAFNKTVVLRYRIQLEARHLSASTINVRLAAVRRLAYEAAEKGGAHCIALNSADEIAVDAFLERRIAFPGIARTIEAVLQATPESHPGTIREVLACDRQAREMAREVLVRTGYEVAAPRS